MCAVNNAAAIDLYSAILVCEQNSKTHVSCCSAYILRILFAYMCQYTNHVMKYFLSFFLKTVRVERYKRLGCINVLMYCCTVKNATNTRQLHSVVFSDVNGQRLSLHFGRGWFDAEQISEFVRCCLFTEENVLRRVVTVPFKGFPTSLYFPSSKLLFTLQPETTFARWIPRERY